MPVPEEVRAAQIARLEAFVLRGRRIGEHSLALDKHRVKAWAEVTMQMTVSEGSGRVVLRQSLPKQEATESLAARVRPLLLNRDPVEFSIVLKALKSLVSASGTEAFVQAAAVLSEQFKEWFPKDEKIAGYEIRTMALDGSDSRTTSDVALALSWIYGDVVHADNDGRVVGESHGIRERYRAAAPWVFRAVLLSGALLNLIKQAEDSGSFALSTEVWTTPVTVTDTDFIIDAEVHVAPVGTAAPDGFEFSDEWEVLQDPSQLFADDVPFDSSAGDNDGASRQPFDAPPQPEDER